MVKRSGRHKYQKHKKTSHRTIYIPEGFVFEAVEKPKHQPDSVRIVFKKKKK